VLGVMFLLFDTVRTILILLGNTIYWGLLSLFTHYKVDKPLQQSKYYEKKQMEQKLIEAEKQQKYKEQILSKQNKIIEAGLSVVREMRVRYPYADESLFQTLLKKFPVMSVNEIKEMEDQIKHSHFENEITYSLDRFQEHQYTMADINGLAPLEQHTEDPIVMRIYKINCDYVIYIRDIDTNVFYMAQSKDYFAISRMVKNVKELQQQLKQAKQHVTAVQLDSICNGIADNTKSFRRNRQGFLD
jgi:hypothetical protein